MHTTPSKIRAAITLLTVLGAGCLTQWLLWSTAVGAGWLVLDVALVATALFAFSDGERRPTVAGWVVAGSAIGSGAAVVYYASVWALVIGFTGSVALVVVLPFVLSRGLRACDLGLLPGAILERARATPDAIVGSARVPAALLDTAGRHHARTFGRGVLIGAPLAVTLTLLLSADAGFAHALGRLTHGTGGALRFVTIATVTGAAYLVAYVLHRGEHNGAAAEQVAPLVPYRCPRDAPGVEESPIASARGPRVRPATWGIVLAQLALVLGVFGAAHAKSLFAGHALARAPGTVTYAQHLHNGFAQVVLATLLAVATVIAGHRLLRARDPAGAPEAVPGGRWLAGLEGLLLALSGIALLSCWQRLRVYEVAYGYTYLRLAVGFALVGVLGLIGVTAVKSLARAWRGFAPSVMALGLVLTLVASWFDADGYVARGNLDRAEATRVGAADPFAWRELDVEYLEELSTDTRSLRAHPVVARDVELSRRLEESWRREEEARRARGWRAFRGLRGR